MPTLQNASSDRFDRPDPRLARTLWQWLALGALAMLLLPEARGAQALLGNLPFWLVVAPGLALITLHRHALAAAWRARLVRATPRRRRRSLETQARRRSKTGVRVHLSSRLGRSSVDHAG